MPSLRLRQFSWALSAAADLVGVTDVLHGRRVALIAEALARQLADRPWSIDDIVLGALLHDCGVSNTEVHEHLLLEMEWASAGDHCRRGAELLAGSQSLRHLAGAIGRHHSAWESVRDPEHPTPDEWLGNLLFLADRVDVLAALTEGDILFNAPAVVERLADLSPRLFCPAFVRALEAASKVEAFWLSRESAPLTHHFAGWIAADKPRELPEEEVWALFEMFGQCVDGKSVFTASHSRAVSRLALELGREAGIEGPQLFRLGLAGLVHDIGKLRVPDAVLNFPGPLVQRDFSVMKHHSFDALEILSRLDGYEEVAEWASLHHERLDGSGYPYQLTAADTPLAVRVLAIADVFQALVQDRPYRAGLAPSEVAGLLRKEAEAGRLDAALVSLMLGRLADYYAVGRGPTAVATPA